MMDRKTFRRLIIKTAQQAAGQSWRLDRCFGYASEYIGEPGRLAQHRITARCFDGVQTDIFVNGKYYTSLFLRDII